MKKISSKERITSIDALRAFALLGILFVHTSQLYNFDNSFNDLSYFTNTGLTIKRLVLLIFEGKCRLIFSILFGVSFYLILRNPQYSIQKFRWRCCILIFFGLFNKIIFTTDILCWYGINGLLLSLLPIRRIKSIYTLYIFIILFSVSLQPFINLREYLFPNADYTLRYIQDSSFKDIISYSKLMIIKEDIHLFWSEGTSTLSYFVFGFYLGKSGYIENISKTTHLRNALTFLFFSISSFTIYRHFNYHPSLHQITNFFTSLFYSSFFFYLYKIIRLEFLDNYGRLGLTNYSVQNWLPIIVFIIVFHPLRISIEYIYLFAFLFYFLQLLFSNYWLRNHKYGPMEFLWRIATNCKYSSNKK